MTGPTANVDRAPGKGPSGLRRLTAIVSLALVFVVMSTTMLQVATQPLRVLAQVALLLVVFAACWVAATSTAPKRFAALAAAVARPSASTS